MTAPRRRSARGAVLTGLLAIVLLVAGAAIVLRVRDAVACTELEMWTSDEKVEEVTTLADMYRHSGRTIDGRCVSIHIDITGSRNTADLLAQDPGTPWTQPTKPDIWSPSSSVWVSRLRAAIATHPGRVSDVPSAPQSVASTPIIIAMPEPMARALGWPEATIGWSDIVALASNPAGWAAKGHPEWGAFTLGKTNPAESTTGLLSTISTATALARTDGELTVADLPRTADAMTALEASTVHYGRYMETFVDNLYRADQDGDALHYVSAIAMEEKVLLDYNRGRLVGTPQRIVTPPKQKLAAIFPADGTMASDDPAIVVDAEWASDVHRRAAADFIAYMVANRQVFTHSGFRDGEGNPDPDPVTSPHQLANGTLAHPQYRVVRTPPTDVVDGVRDLWQRTRRRANVLMVMDVSESMGTPVAGSGKSRLALAQMAADVVPGQLATGDQIGLWEFSSEIAKDAHPWRPLLPFGTASDVADAFTARVAGMQPLGQTALYATTRAAVSFVDSRFDPSRINAIVLLSDGHNEYPPDDDLPRLLADLQQSEKDHPVRVFTIAYGSEADAASLEQISQATRARSYTASDATQIQDVMLDVLSNF